MQPEELARMPEKIEGLFLGTQDRIMQDVVRRIRKTGEITSTADYQLERMRILGNSSEYIESELSELLNASYAEVWELYDKVLEKEYVRNKDLYEQINAVYVPYEESEILQGWTAAIIKQTEGELKNLTRSLGFSLVYSGGKRVFTPFSEYYQEYLDKACMDIVTGAFDYNTVLRRVVTEMTNSGIRTVDYASGRSNRIDVAARRAVLTGVHQLSAKINEQVASDLGTDSYEVTWHSGHRPEHWWGGRVYTKKQLVNVCRLGEVDGLCGANCRHSYYAFFPGISVRTYTDEQLAEMEAKEQKTRVWNGKEYNAYQATQKQRQMETAMRAQREKVGLLKEGKADSDEIMLARCKYQGQLDEYARFSKKMGLKQQRERIYYDMRGRMAPMPSFIKLSDTTDKWGKDARKELLKSEQSIGNRKRETMEVYSPTGEYILTKRGDSNSVSLSVFDYRKLKDAVVTHNHPSGGSFSSDDIKFLKTMPISELRVSTGEGTYFIRKPKNWPKEINTGKKIEEVMSDIKNELKPKYQKMYNKGEINKRQRHQMFIDEVNQVFAERYGLEYGRETYG